MGGGTAPDTANVAQCGDDTIVLAVNPWIGAKANAAVAQVLMEQQMGCTVELEDPIAEKAQFPAMADGDVDATLEVWPSGHADDYAQFIEEAGTVVDGGLLGITGNIGWFVPSYVIDEYPQYATWEGFQDDADVFSTADTGDKVGSSARTRRTRSSTSRSSRRSTSISRSSTAAARTRRSRRWTPRCRTRIPS